MSVLPAMIDRRTPIRLHAFVTVTADVPLLGLAKRYHQIARFRYSVDISG
jgi:hypothetical protein